MRRPRSASRPAAVAGLVVLGLAPPVLTGCAAAPPVAGALPQAPAAPRAVRPSSVIAATPGDQQDAAGAPSALSDRVTGADLATGEGTTVASVAALGPLDAPGSPSSAAARGPAAYATVLAYLAAVVTLRRTGDDAGFLALTTARCTCRSLRGEAVARASAGGVPGFDVEIVRAVEVDPVDTLRTVIEADLVIPAHTDPAAPGLPRERVPEARPHLALLVDFRSGAGLVDAVLQRAEQGGAR